MLLGISLFIVLSLVGVFAPTALVAWGAVEIGKRLLVRRRRRRELTAQAGPGSYKASSVRTAEAAFSENTASIIPAP